MKDADSANRVRGSKGRGGRGRWNKGRGAKGRGAKGRGAGAITPLIPPHVNGPHALAAACAASDDTTRLAGDGVDTSPPRYVLLRMMGNDKYLAPREQGIVYAAVRRRFHVEGSVPLARIAWRVVPQRNGWVQLQHVLTGRYMRLVPPPDPVQCMHMEAPTHD